MFIWGDIYVKCKTCYSFSQNLLLPVTEGSGFSYHLSHELMVDHFNSINKVPLIIALIKLTARVLFIITKKSSQSRIGSLGHGIPGLVKPNYSLEKYLGFRFFRIF